MTRGADPVVQCAPRLFRLVVAADIVAEKVVREQQVSSASPDLLRRREADRRIGAEHLRAVTAEVPGMCQVRSRPHPQVAGILIST